MTVFRLDRASLWVLVLIWPIVAPIPSHAWDAPGTNTVGLVWYEIASVWIAGDRDANMIYYAAHMGDTWFEFPGWRGKPGSLTLADSGLWVVKEEEGVLVRLDLTTSPPAQTTVPIPPEAIREFHAITGLAWDGSTIWIATGCGLCSQVIQYSVDRREVLQSFFPKCEPRGLIYRPKNGNVKAKLTTVAYSGPYLSAYFSSWALTGHPATADSFQEFNTFGRRVTPPKDPTAIGFRNGKIWVVDRETGTISQYSLGDMP